MRTHISNGGTLQLFFVQRILIPLLLAYMLCLFPPTKLHAASQPFVDKQTANLDSDNDGISDLDEARIGTDPMNIDSDCDYIADLAEIGDLAGPADSDGDGIIDALESRHADANANLISDQQDPSLAPQVHCGQFYPYALTDGVDESARLEISLAGVEVDSVSMVANQQSFYMPQLNGTAINVDDVIALFDDGTNGDRMANDGIWTRSGFQFAAQLPSNRWDTYEFNLINVVQDGTTIQIDRRALFNSSFGDVVLGVVHQEDIQEPSTVSGLVQQTSQLVNIADPRLALDVLNAEGLQSVSQRFYQHFFDEYDFLFFFPDAPAVDAPFGLFNNVQNTIQNIGIAQFDNSSQYGSTARLQGVTFLNFDTNGPTIHEVLHNWSAPVLQNLGLGECNVGSHWGASGIGVGQHGGFDPATLIDNGNGSYSASSFGLVANGGDTVGYAPLELYLAGFADASEVADILVPENLDCSSFDYSVQGQVSFQADSMRTLTMAEITAELGGPRSPAYPNAQQEFQAAMVIVSKSLLTPAEMTFFNNRAELFGAPTGDAWVDGFYLSFEEATGGRATINTLIGDARPEFIPTDFIFVPAIFTR